MWPPQRPVTRVPCGGCLPGGQARPCGQRRQGWRVRPAARAQPDRGDTFPQVKPSHELSAVAVLIGRILPRNPTPMYRQCLGGGDHCLVSEGWFWSAGDEARVRGEFTVDPSPGGLIDKGTKGKRAHRSGRPACLEAMTFSLPSGGSAVAGGRCRRPTSPGKSARVGLVRCRCCALLLHGPSQRPRRLASSAPRCELVAWWSIVAAGAGQKDYSGRMRSMPGGCGCCRLLLPDPGADR